MKCPNVSTQHITHSKIIQSIRITYKKYKVYRGSSDLYKLKTERITIHKTINSNHKF
jgi:hypothetical protein